MQIFCGHAMESVHPPLKATGIGIDVLYMVNLGPYSYPGTDVNWTMRQSMFLRDSREDTVPTPISTKDRIIRNERFQDVANILFVRGRQDVVGRPPLSVTRN